MEESEIRAAMAACIAPEQVGKKLADAVKAGEAWAITLWYAYYYGKPRERIELGGVDGGPIPVQFSLTDALADLAVSETESEDDPGEQGDGQGFGDGA